MPSKWGSDSLSDEVRCFQAIKIEITSVHAEDALPQPAGLTARCCACPCPTALIYHAPPHIQALVQQKRAGNLYTSLTAQHLPSLFNCTLKCKQLNLYVGI